MQLAIRVSKQTALQVDYFSSPLLILLKPFLSSARSALQDEAFHIPEDEAFSNDSISHDVLTFVFARHPFARYTSKY